jgi:HlyD family secretion protein
MVAIAAVVVALVVWGFRPQPVPVDAAAVRRAPLRVTVEEEGKTRARDRYVISAPVAGYMRRLPWDSGDPVRSGDIVARLEPLRPQTLDPRSREQAEARVRVATAALRAAEERAQASAQQARTAQVDAAYWKRELERVSRLRESGDVAAERFDRTQFEARRSETALRAAEQAAAAVRVEVETARAEVGAAKAALIGPGAANGGEVVPVRAPVSGRVLRVVRESEGVVNPGEPLLEIANARALEVEVEVLSADAVKMGPGTRVIFTRWGGEGPLEGRVRTVEPTGFTKISALGVEEQRVRVIADITSPEAEWRRLGDGYRVEASFVLWEDETVLQVPASALFRQGDGWAVFTVENGAARRRAVTPGRRTGLAVQILSGLKEGEPVITHPDDTVEDGKAVKTRDSTLNSRFPGK